MNNRVNMLNIQSRKTYHTPIIGSASFPLTINKGNNMEKTQPLKKILFIITVDTI